MLSLVCNRFEIKMLVLIGKLLKADFSYITLPKQSIIVIFILFFVPISSFSDALDLPKISGWTEFSPSSDTRIMYVSEFGNDSNAQVYSNSSPEVSGSPFNPAGAVKAFATYTAAYAHTREGFPDWILFKRGETFYDPPGKLVRSGRGGLEPFLIGSYGASGASPLIKSGTGRGVNISKESSANPGTFAYIAVMGLKFYAHTRNPDDPAFAGYQDGGGEGVAITTYNSGNYVRNILIEGCSFSYYSNNIVAQGALEDIDLRRNVIMHSYSIDSHAQGLFASGVDRILVEENIFDHNGWLIQSDGNDRTNGGATFHNHNVYTDGIQNATFRKNLFMRASSIGTKLQNRMEGLVVDNNLYIDGELGIESCNNYEYYYYRVKEASITNNVFYQLGLSNPTKRNVAWGMWLQGWDGGDVKNNLLIGQRGQMFINLGLRSRGMEISHNVGLLKDMYAIYQNSSVPLLSMSIHDNYFERTDSGTATMIKSSDSSIAGITFKKNTYFSPSAIEFQIDSSIYNPSQWEAGFESDAKFSKKTFPDASRNIESYMRAIGRTGTLDAFIDLCRAQDMYSWDEHLSAETVNSWIRGGFGMSTEIPSSVLSPISLRIKTP